MYLIAVYRENWEISTEKNALDRNLSEETSKRLKSHTLKKK